MMPRLLLAAVAPFVISVQSLSSAASRPNFSGNWTLTTKGGICPLSLTVTQDESSLRVQMDSNAPARIYRFDGLDAAEILPSAPTRPANMPSTAYDAHRTKSVARAAWNGDQFVVVTHTTMTMTWPSQTAGEFERDITSSEAYAFNGERQLIVAHRVIVDPLPGGSANAIDLPNAWNCTYARAADSKRPFGRFE